MNMKNLRVPLIVLAALITGALLFGGRFVYQRLKTDNPFNAAMLAIPGIRGYEAEKGEDGYTLKLEMTPVSDLQAAVESAVETASRFGRAPIRNVVLQDRPNRKLQNAYYEMHFVVEEAAELGNFTEMKSRIDQIAKRAGLDACRVQVTDGQLYVRLNEGGAYLYRIVNRSVAVAGPIAAPVKGGLWQ